MDPKSIDIDSDLGSLSDSAGLLGDSIDWFRDIHRHSVRDYSVRDCYDGVHRTV